MRGRLVAVLAIVLGVFPRPLALGQFIGFTSPQTQQQVLASNVACTGSNQFFAIQNLGQTTHNLVWKNPGGTSFSLVLLGSYDGTNYVEFSDEALSLSGLLQATGYYPALRASVLCNPGSSFSLDYSGTSTFAMQGSGFAQHASYSKTFGLQLPAGTTVAKNIAVPYGTSGSAIFFEYFSTGPAGSSISVVAVQPTGPGLVLLSAHPLSTAAGQQAILIPNVPALELIVSYTAGGASSATYNLENDFYTPGMMPYSTDPCNFGLFSNCPIMPTLGVVHGVHPAGLHNRPGRPNHQSRP